MLLFLRQFRKRIRREKKILMPLEEKRKRKKLGFKKNWESSKFKVGLWKRLPK